LELEQLVVAHLSPARDGQGFLAHTAVEDCSRSRSGAIAKRSATKKLKQWRRLLRAHEAEVVFLALHHHILLSGRKIGIAQPKALSTLRQASSTLYALRWGKPFIRGVTSPIDKQPATPCARRSATNGLAPPIARVRQGSARASFAVTIFQANGRARESAAAANHRRFGAAAR
jgi:hypothetical protein